MGKYTEEERKFILENVEGTKYRVLAEKFNKKFKKNKTRKQIKEYCARHNIRNNINSKETQFQKGHKPHNSYKPLGVEKETVHGDVLVKVKSGKVEGRHWKNWELKKVLVWEKHNGKKPDDLMVFHLNGNKKDCNISNLVLVGAHENMQMHRDNLVFGNPELTLAGLYYIRLKRIRIKRESELRKGC